MPVNPGSLYHSYYEITSTSQRFQPDSSTAANDETHYEEPLPSLNPPLYVEVIPEPLHHNNSHESIRQPHKQ